MVCDKMFGMRRLYSIKSSCIPCKIRAQWTLCQTVVYISLLLFQNKFNRMSWEEKNIFDYPKFDKNDIRKKMYKNWNICLNNE